MSSPDCPPDCDTETDATDTNAGDQCDPLLCCFAFLTLSGCRNRVTQKLLYFPPSPPMYTIENDTFWCVDIDENNVKHSPISPPDMAFTKIPTAAGNHIATLFLPTSPPSPLTILFSHGNAADLGAMKPFLQAMARKLNANIFAYDYSGYGLSTGVPTPRNTLLDAEAAFDYMVKTYPAETQQVIVYGQSLGSAPTTWLGKTRPEKVSGVVVHSGLGSALRCIRPVRDTCWYDIFPNVDWVRDVQAPLFVIHGTNDQGIHVRHGETMVKNAQRPYQPWYVLGGGHNDIELNFRTMYYRKLKNFVTDVREGTCVNIKDVVPASQDKGSSQPQALSM